MYFELNHLNLCRIDFLQMFTLFFVFDDVSHNRCYVRMLACLPAICYWLLTESSSNCFNFILNSIIMHRIPLFRNIYSSFFFFIKLIFGRELLVPVLSGFWFLLDKEFKKRSSGYLKQTIDGLEKHAKQNPTGKTPQLHEYNLSVVV